MIPKESRNNLALDTFIKAHPELIEEMKELSAEDRQQQILWAFEDEAESRGLEAWELALELIARSLKSSRACALKYIRKLPKPWT